MHKICENCQKPYKPSAANWKRTRYCGIPCYVDWRRRPENVATRFWAKVDKGDGCWLWLGARSSASGYATFNYRGHNINGHRAAWLIVNGEIPEGMDVLHTCHNGHLGCVRPDHLRLGTHDENMAEMAALGRSRWGEKGRHAKLKAEDVRAIKAAYWYDRARKKSNALELAAKYGVGRWAVLAVVAGRSWKRLA